MLQPMTEREVASHADHLADVLGIWDCYEQEWVTDAPIVLRFESEDVVIGARNGPPCLLRDGEDELLERLRLDEAMSERCLCWRRMRVREGLVGEVASVGSVMAMLAEGHQSAMSASRSR